MPTPLVGTKLGRYRVLEMANLELGEALESTDVAGACAAYDVVVKRWGNAPRSRSAAKARERRNALGCNRGEADTQ